VSFDTSSLVTSLHGSSVVGAAVGAADAEIAAVGLGVLVAEVELAASELADGVDALHAASSTILNPATTANVGRCIYFSFPSDGDHAPFWVSASQRNARQPRRGWSRSRGWSTRHAIGDRRSIGRPRWPTTRGSFLKDNGAGKTQLCIKFATGTVSILVTEG